MKGLEEIIGIQTITLDIDPFLSYRTMPGNGVCLYFSTPFYPVNDKNRFEITYKLDGFEAAMRKKFKKDLKRFNCKKEKF